MPQIQLIQSCPVRRQAVGGDRLRLDRLDVQKTSEKPQRRLRISPRLDHEVQDLASVIDGTSQMHPPSADPTDHLVQMPSRRRRRPAALQSPRNERPELDRPAPDRLVADVDPSLRQKFLDIAKAEAESKVQPNGMADDIRRKSMVLERDRLRENIIPVSGLGRSKWRQVSVSLTAPRTNCADGQTTMMLGGLGLSPTTLFENQRRKAVIASIGRSRRPVP